MSYADLLAVKTRPVESVGHEPGSLHDGLFDYQEALVRWAVRRGRAAIFADTGLGKTRMQVEWAHEMGASCLIVAPLAVAEQTIAEAARIGREVTWAAEQPDEPGIYITNYEKLHRFKPEAWFAVVLDESSILKSLDGKTRTKLIKEWTAPKFRLCCTATPAPNDIAEIANHAEFLGIMPRREMLATFFVHDDSVWRLKGHAREAFFRWMATWGMFLRRPSDLGFSDEGFNLPALNISERRVVVDFEPDVVLFPAMAPGIQGRGIARRGSLAARVAETARMIQESPGQWLVWCGLNQEGTALAAALGDEAVNIEGADSAETKLAREQAWRTGEVRVLITKPRIFGFGMNWQHCHQMAFLGLGDSWEQYYQAIRRCWRFGQSESVRVEIVLSDAEGLVAQNVQRKEREAQAMAAEVIGFVAQAEREALGILEPAETAEYRTAQAEGDGWKLLLGDCIERMAEIPDATAGLSVHSPPFASLYTYSASPRDLGNCKDYEQFFEQYRFAIPELLRITKPGRRACVHVQQVTMTQTTHGVIGWFDFRADVVRAYVQAGWIYDGEVVIDKDPQAQAIRTKSKALMFVQKNKDSAWSRPAMADYILLFRAPGENAEQVKTDVTNEEWILWARPIWYGIRESKTLQASAARSERDDKHIAPLQLETVERCIRLWSNPGDTVVDPFTGIGTTGYVAVRSGRRFVGVELKESYFAQAVKNLQGAQSQLSLL